MELSSCGAKVVKENLAFLGTVEEMSFHRASIQNKGVMCALLRNSSSAWICTTAAHSAGYSRDFE